MAEAKHGRLLFVDDEVELRSALCETLADEGYETVGASNGAEGLKALDKQDFDVLLSDLMMPGMDGIQLLRKALETDPTLVGIIMTGQGTIPSAIEAIKKRGLRLRAQALQSSDDAAHFGPCGGRAAVASGERASAPVRQGAKLRVAALPNDWLRPG
jgi:CheY-like chemotaxis protein